MPDVMHTVNELVKWLIRGLILRIFTNPEPIRKRKIFFNQPKIRFLYVPFMHTIDTTIDLGMNCPMPLMD